jgi:hypothetical protein
MPVDFPYGEIYGINSSGKMVGIMWDSDQEGATEHAFMFDEQNGVQDLNDLIDSGSGWVLTFARDINDDGKIAGYGELNQEKRGFLLNPYTPLTPPPATVLVSPANGASQAGTSVTFSWNAAPGAEDYCLHVIDVSGYVLFYQWVGNVTSYTVTGLPDDGRVLLWRVLTRNKAGNGAWSEQWTLNGEAEPPPATALVSPANGVYQAGASVTFSWSAVSEASDYCLRVMDDSENILFYQWVGKVTSYTVTGLPDDGRVLLWRVLTKNIVGNGLWSEQWTFLNGSGT